MRGALKAGRVARLLAAGAALLFAATFFLLGDLGRYNDDYYFVQRVPETWAIRSLILDRPVHLWRPLLRVVSPGLQTLFADHAWMLHALCTLLHGCVVALLYHLLRRIGAGWRTAAAAAALFMVCVAQHEAVFWLSCLPTLFACVLVLAMLHLHLWWVSRPTGAERDAGLARLTPLLMLPAAFLAACLNEQPAGLLGALAPLGLLLPAPAGVERRLWIRRCVVPWVLAGAGFALYLYFHARAGYGTPARLGAAEALRAVLFNARRIVSRWPAEIAPLEFLRGALLQARLVLQAHPVRAMLLAAAMLAAIAWLAQRWMTRDADQTPHPESPRPAPWRIAAIGLLIFLAGWAPIALAHSQVLPRLHYPPGIGLAILLAGALMMFARRAPRLAASPKFRLVSMVALAVVLLVQTVALIGVQDAYRRRHEIDVGQATQLRGLFGNAPPGTVFLPLRASTRSTSIGVPAFDDFLRPAWHWSYAAQTHAALVFRRSDIDVITTGFPGGTRQWAMPGYETSRLVIHNAPGLPRIYRASERVPDGRVGGMFEWSVLAPFIVDDRGQVQPVTNVQVLDADGNVQAEFTPPIAAKLGLWDGETMTVRPLPPRQTVPPGSPARLRRERRMTADAPAQ